MSLRASGNNLHFLKLPGNGFEIRNITTLTPSLLEELVLDFIQLLELLICLWSIWIPLNLTECLLQWNLYDLSQNKQSKSIQCSLTISTTPTHPNPPTTKILDFWVCFSSYFKCMLSFQKVPITETSSTTQLDITLNPAEPYRMLTTMKLVWSQSEQTE